MKFAVGLIIGFLSAALPLGAEELNGVSTPPSNVSILVNTTPDGSMGFTCEPADAQWCKNLAQETAKSSIEQRISKLEARVSALEHPHVTLSTHNGSVDIEEVPWDSLTAPVKPKR